MSNLYLFGRSQDLALQKARDNIHQRNHLRLWLSPMLYHGRQVWVGQISRDIGSRLTIHTPTLTTHKIDPDVDEARDALMEDMAYSQSLAKMGLVEGVGAAARSAPRENLTDPVLHRRAPQRAGVRPPADFARRDRDPAVACRRNDAAAPLARWRSFSRSPAARPGGRLPG